MGHNRRSFTLVELLIAVTVVSLVAVALYSVFSNGLKAWRIGNRDRSYARNLRLVSEKMDRDLRNAFQFSHIPFEGTEDSIMFAALVLVESDADEDISESEEEAAEHCAVGRIAYFYDSQKDALCREVKPFSEVFADEEVGEGEVLIEYVGDLELSYCYLDNATENYKWKDDWETEEQDSIPQAVKIEMSFKKGSERKEDFVKTVFLPVGTGEQKIELGSITRQLDTE